MKIKLIGTCLVLCGFFCLPLNGFAHPVPNSVLLLDIKSGGIAADLELPLGELQFAFGKDVTTHPETLIVRLGPELKAYVFAHLHPTTNDGAPWTVTLNGMQVQKAEQSDTGPFQELKVQLWLEPPAGKSTRILTLHYDVITHQVVTHKTLVAIRQDWESGKVGDGQTEVGVIGLNPKDNSIPALQINLDKGSNWRGFMSMVRLGIQHISEGTDHLLFLLVLLLSAPLIARNGRWAESGGTKHSMLHLMKIATAFTIGHSITLLAGALGWLRPPSQPVEILIAISILITAIHAVKPLFPGREIYVAAGFGLVHGLAFATVLSSLKLEGGKMALSILGFNLGIELMQLFIIIMVVPWLIILSNARYYSGVRIAGAIVAAIASLAWIAERCINRPNAVSSFIQKAAEKGKWVVLTLAVLAMISHFGAKKIKTHSNGSF